MKKNILVISICLLSLIIALFWLVPILNIVMSQGNNQEDFLFSSDSPDGKYTLEAYRTDPGATVDFSIKVYLIKDEKKELIYNAYHEREAEVVWIDNENVSINGKTLDLSSGETYDWRKK